MCPEHAHALPPQFDILIGALYLSVLSTQVPPLPDSLIVTVLKTALWLQDLFYDDDSVLFIDIHQHQVWPGSGHVNESGQGAGDGYTINVPLPGQSQKSFLEGPALEDHHLMPGYYWR